MLLADIAHGHTDGADILFLIAAILFGIAAVVAFMQKSIFAVLGYAGLFCVALAWVLL